MISDPIYRAIIEGLERRDTFSGDQFEACAVGLLQDRFPGLVPIPGGNDGGMDGAIADLEGEAYPLVCTIAAKGLANLTRSLKRYKKTGGERRKAVFVTCRRMTPQQRRNLRQRARELSFTLVQVYEQRAIATLLYRRSDWRRSLLEIDGHPPALSVLPSNLRRHLVELEVRGRDEDFQWLRSTRSDRVLVGEPGSGKTYLLYCLALEGWGLFLASESEERIADALREQKPEVVIVDDAHTDPSRLSRLRALREQWTHRFDIVASTWRGAEDEVRNALGVGSSKVRRLELLTRREILDLYAEMGVSAEEFGLEKERILGSLADQAANRPGLAVTLGTLWLEGDWWAVLEGKALHGSQLPVLSRCLGRDENELLATLALGGSSGMPQQELAADLGIDRLELRRRLAGLAAAGVLRDRGGDCWSVEPAELRSALLASVFFDPDLPGLDYRHYLDMVPSRGSTTLELVLAAGRGADVSREELQDLLTQLEFHPWSLGREKEAWLTFARLGLDESRWAIDHFPGDAVEVLTASLAEAPREAVQGLLRRAHDESDALPNSPMHPLQPLKEWIEEITEPIERSLHRRQLLLREARSWAIADPRHLAAFRAGCLALSPKLQSQVETADRNGVGFFSGLLPRPAIEQMKEVWQDFLALLEVTGIPRWADLQEGLWYWIHPEIAFFDGGTPEIPRELMADLAQGFLRDLVPFVQESPGMVSALSRLASRAGLDLDSGLDPVFELLYPEEDPRLAKEQFRKKAERKLKRLASDWADKPSAEIAQEMERYAAEARRVGIRYPDQTPELLGLLSQQSTEPAELLRSMIEQEAGAERVLAVVETASAALIDPFLPLLLESEEYRGVAVSQLLGRAEPSVDLISKTVEAAKGFLNVVWARARRGELSLQWAEQLLASEDPDLVLFTASGEWDAEPRGSVRPELLTAWREAVLRFGSTERSEPMTLDSRAGKRLAEILVQDSDLAFEWLRRHGALAGRYFQARLLKIAEKTLTSLDREHREVLIRELEPRSPLSRLLPQLVDGCPGLYRQLLDRSSLEDFRLAPLRTRDPFGPWPRLVDLALESGLDPRRMAPVLIDFFTGWEVEEQRYWEGWSEALERFAEARGGEAARQLVEEGRAIVEKGLGQLRTRKQRMAQHGALAS